MLKKLTWHNFSANRDQININISRQYRHSAHTSLVHLIHYTEKKKKCEAPPKLTNKSFIKIFQTNKPKVTFLFT